MAASLVPFLGQIIVPIHKGLRFVWILFKYATKISKKLKQVNRHKNKFKKARKLYKLLTKIIKPILILNTAIIYMLIPGVFILFLSVNTFLFNREVKNIKKINAFVLGTCVLSLISTVALLVIKTMVTNILNNVSDSNFDTDRLVIFKIEPEEGFISLLVSSISSTISSVLFFIALNISQILPYRYSYTRVDGNDEFDESNENDLKEEEKNLFLSSKKKLRAVAA